MGRRITWFLFGAIVASVIWMALIVSGHEQLFDAILQAR